MLAYINFSDPLLEILLLLFSSHIVQLLSSQAYLSFLQPDLKFHSFGVLR